MIAPDAVAPPAAPAVALERVSKRYGGVVALDDVSLAVPGGGFLALVGESGAGKTTVLRCLLRLEEVDAGRVTIGGRDVRDGSAVLLRRALGYVPQDAGLLPHWTARRNAALVPSLPGAADAGRRADDALALVGLDPALGARGPHELSGGQRQRVAVARALAGGQALLLLDEPFGALDAVTRHDLQQMLLDVRARRTLTAVLVTHDLREALRLATLVAVLRAGRVEQCAPPDALRTAPATDYVARLLERSGALA